MNIANDNMSKAAPCPICRKAPTETYKPFCSKRCADVDLARWLGGTYAIPAAPGDPDEDEDEPAPRRPRPSDED
jgi:endogenous inhibitor of DNA gyrase (YacG/DUF329 family)